MSKTFNVSVIIPAFDEEAIIGNTLDQLHTYLKRHPELGSCEVVVVAAGSDRTADIAKMYAKKFDGLQVVVPDGRVGKGRDVKLGFQAAKGAYQLFTDADLSTPLHHITAMVKLLEDGNDVVIGKRQLAKIHKGKLRSLLSVASNWLIRSLLLRGVGDSQCGFKGFKAEAAKKLFVDSLRVNGWAFDVEVLVAARQAKFRITQLPIDDWHETREDDLRNEGLRKAALMTLRDVFAIRLRLWGMSIARRVNYLIVAAGASSFGLALWVGSQQSLWFDEAYSVALTEHSYGQLIQLTSVDVHPPLFYILLKAWSSVFGSSDIALRSFSAFCCGLAVIIGLLLVKRLWGARATVLSLPFVIAAPFLLRYGFEVRMYALASLIGIAATYLLVLAQQATPSRSRRRLWILYGVLVAAGMYTLYYTALIWITHLVWCVYLAEKTHGQLGFKALLKQPWARAIILSIVLFLPWLPWFVKQFANVQGWFWIGPPTYHTVMSVWSFFFSYMAEWQLNAWWSFVYMLALGFAVYFVATAVKMASSWQKQGLILLILYSLLPIALLYVLSLPPLRPIFIDRYVSQVILATYLLLGVSIAIVLKHRRQLLLKGAATGLLAVMVVGVVHLHAVGNFSYEQLLKPSAKQIAAYVASRDNNGAPIVADGPYSFIELHHYLPDQNLWFYSRKPVGTAGGYAMLHNSPQLVNSSDAFANQNVWIVYGGQNPVYVPAHHVRGEGTTIGKYRAYYYVAQSDSKPSKS